MSRKETPLKGGDLATLVADKTVTREAAEAFLNKITIAIRNHYHVSAIKHTSERGTVSLKVYPLDPSEAKKYNQKHGSSVFVDPTEWYKAYKKQPLPA